MGRKIIVSSVWASCSGVRGGFVSEVGGGMADVDDVDDVDEPEIYGRPSTSLSGSWLATDQSLSHVLRSVSRLLPEWGDDFELVSFLVERNVWDPEEMWDFGSFIAVVVGCPWREAIERLPDDFAPRVVERRTSRVELLEVLVECRSVDVPGCVADAIESLPEGARLVDVTTSEVWDEKGWRIAVMFQLADESHT